MPSLAGGGAERTLINLLQIIDYNKYEVDLVLVLKKGPYLNQVPDHVHLITLFNNEFLVRVLAYLQKKIGLSFFLKLKTILKVKGTYDVGISFLDGNFTDLLLFVKNIKKRYTWVHSSYKTYRNFARFYENKRYKEKLKRNRYAVLDGIYFVSRDSMIEFIEIFGEFPNMQVVYNPINANIVKEKSKESVAFIPGCFTFIAVGSLLPVKGFDRLIRASKIIADKGYKFELHILGMGQEEEKLQDLIKDLNLSEFIKMKGFVNNPYPYMKQADVFVMSSISEALPTVLCEAMILGKPTLVTNCSGCRELVSSGEYGMMAEQNDVDLANKMIQYLSQPELVIEYGARSLKRSELFDDKKIIQEYYDIFNS